MKGSEVIDGEWQTAPRKRTIKTSATPKVTTRPIQQGAVLKEASPPYATIIRQVEVCKASLEVSEYFGFVSGIVSHGLPAGEKYDSIVALGIGSLVSPTSQLQLALCLCLCKLLLTSGGYSSCSVFDPVLTDMDRELYLHLGIPVLTVNSKGKHSVTARTLFFMPHCPYRLYCNVLWANWENLERIHIFGNSFQSYGLRRMHSSGTCTSRSDRKPNGRKNKAKVADSTAAATACVDPADMVALLAPYLQEIDLWPYLPQTAPLPATLVDPVQGHSEESSPSSDALVQLPVSSGACRSRFLKEAAAVPALRHLENAVCDMSLMCISSAVSSEARERLLSLRPTEALIDEAALNDVELF